MNSDSVETAREWPLAGREGEIAAIEAGYRRPQLHGVMLTGVAGVGKSRVAWEAAARLERSGCRVEYVGARRGLHGVPFAAITHLAPEVDDGRALLSRLISDFRVASPDRTVVVLDDAHLLDEASGAVLAQLMTSRLVFVIGTVDPRRGGVPEALAAVWNSGRIIDLPIHSLPTQTMVWLIDRVCGTDADVIHRRRLARASGGNPLTLRALLEAGAASAGGLRQAAPARGPAEAAADGFAHALIKRWLDEAGPSAREVVELVACAEPVPMLLLEKHVEPAGVEAAERAGLVRVTEGSTGPTVMLGPPLCGPLVRLLLTNGVVRRVYARLASTLLQSPTVGRDHVLRAGEWQVRAGTVTAPEYLLPAAREAMAHFDLELATNLAEAAREHHREPAADLVLAQALLQRGQGHRALNALPTRPPDDPEQAAAWALTAAQVGYFGLGGPAHQAERTLERVVHGRNEAEAKKSWIQLADGRYNEALSTARSVLSSPDAGPQATIWASAAGAAAAGLLGRSAQSEALVQHGMTVVDAAARERFPWGAAQVGYGDCLARLMRGDLHGAQELADRGYGEAVVAEARAMAGIWAGLRGMTAAMQGRVRFAARRLREALTLSEGEGTYCLKSVWMAELAAAVAMFGDGEEAHRWLAQADSCHHCHAGAFEARIALSRAWLHVSRGELSQAVESSRLAVESSSKHGILAYEAMALYDVARLGAASDVHIRLADLARATDSEVVAVKAMAARALSRHDRNGLGRATDAFERLGYTLLAAEAAAAASHARRLVGHNTSAVLFQERAEALAQRCEGARTPLLDRWRLPSQLTPRERDVLLLAPSLTSPQIAARLGLSPRTVSNYLQSAYDKLNLTGRADLRVLLGRRPSSADPAGPTALR